MAKLLMITAMALLLLSPEAWAIKRVSKQDSKAVRDSIQKAPPQTPDNRKSATLEKGKPPKDNRLQQPPKPDSGRPVEKDRFIDENGDGINDNLKKPPEVIKKKKDDGREKSSKKK